MSNNDVSSVHGEVGIKLVCTIKYVSLFEGMLKQFIERYGSLSSGASLCCEVVSDAVHKYFTRLFFQRGLFVRSFSHRPDERAFVFELGLFSDDKSFTVDFRQSQTVVNFAPDDLTLRVLEVSKS